MGNYYTLRYLKLPYIFFVACMMYTISWWISVPLEIYAMIDEDNALYKTVNRYYTFAWILVECFVLCCLCAVIIKLKRMLSRTHQYVSMFVIDKDMTAKNKQIVKIKLRCWMWIVCLLAIYYVQTIAYWVSVTYIFKGQFAWHQTFSTFLYICAQMTLNLVLYYYTHSLYRYDVIVDKAS